MENISTSDKTQHKRKKMLPLQCESQRSSLAQAFYYNGDDSGNKQMTNLNGRFTIVWIKSGILNLVDHFKVTQINGNQLLCILPSHNFHLVPSDDMEAYLLSFSDDFLLMAGGKEAYPFSLHCASRQGSYPYIDLGAGMGNDVENIMKLVINKVDTSCHFGMEIFKGLLQIFAVYFSRGGEIQSNPAPLTGCDEELFLRFTKLLDNNYVTKKSVIEYANAMAVSASYLSDTIKRVSGHRASFHIHQRVIREAKLIAANSRSSMKEVAYKVGFTDIAHFSKFFRSQTGINFTEYKKLIV